MSEKPNLEVVRLRNGLPSLQDIAGWLRTMADRIERAEEQDIRTLLIVTETADGKVPPPCCLGDNPSRSEIVGLLTRAGHKAVDWGWDT